jgi:hypothetical protein
MVGNEEAKRTVGVKAGAAINYFCGGQQDEKRAEGAGWLAGASNVVWRRVGAGTRRAQVGNVPLEAGGTARKETRSDSDSDSGQGVINAWLV